MGRQFNRGRREKGKVNCNALRKENLELRKENEYLKRLLIEIGAFPKSSELSLPEEICDLASEIIQSELSNSYHCLECESENGKIVDLAYTVVWSCNECHNQHILRKRSYDQAIKYLQSHPW